MENKNNDKKVINCKFSQIFLEFVALLLVWNDSNSVFLRQLKRNNLKQIRNMKKIRAAVVGYGNIGKFTLEALEAAPDFEVAGIVRRNGAENKPAELADYPVVKDRTERCRCSYSGNSDPQRRTICKRNPCIRHQHGRQLRHPHSDYQPAPFFG